MNDPWYRFSRFLKERFQHPVRKLPLNAGFHCPNRDGSRSRTGCVFCDTFGSGPIPVFDLPVEEQIRRRVNRGGKENPLWIAYFQAHDSLNASPEMLAETFEKIFDYSRIVGLFIGTRPDSVGREVMPLLGRLKERIPLLAVELGLQSLHPRSLEYLNRNHTVEDFHRAFERLSAAGIDVVVHLIVGIPGESREDMLSTAQRISRMKPAGVKLHLFHVLKNTPLWSWYQQGKVVLMKRDVYEETVIDILRVLDPAIVIHRITGERDREIFHAPRWALDKSRVIQSIRRKMVQRGVVQGDHRESG